jgi:hypothetical protein
MEGLFILRSSSINGVTDMRTFIEHLQRTLGGRVAGVPLWLTLQAKQSAMSHQSVFWYASLRPRFASLIEAATRLAEVRAQEAALGIDRAAGEQVLVDLLANGCFADQSDEDGAQFEDLIAARFKQEADGEKVQAVAVGLRRRARSKASGTVASETMTQLQDLLTAKTGESQTTATEPPIEVSASQRRRVPSLINQACALNMGDVRAMPLPVLHGLDGSSAPQAATQLAATP